jgi:hypothetical protein
MNTQRLWPVMLSLTPRPRFAFRHQSKLYYPHRDSVHEADRIEQRRRRYT